VNGNGVNGTLSNSVLEELADIVWEPLHGIGDRLDWADWIGFAADQLELSKKMAERDAELCQKVMEMARLAVVRDCSKEELEDRLGIALSELNTLFRATEEAGPADE